MDTCPLHAVFSTLSYGEHEDVLQFFAYSHVDCSVPSSSSSTPSLTSRSAAMRTPGSVPVSRNVWLNWSKHSSGWYSTVRKTLLIFSYGMNWITVTKTIHINHIYILCNWKCKWQRERNGFTEMRIRTWLTGTLHCRFYRPHCYETIAILFWTSGAGTVTVMQVIMVF